MGDYLPCLLQRAGAKQFRSTTLSRAPKKNMTTIFAPIAVAPNPNFKERLRATASKAGNITDKCHGNEIPWERVKATSRTYETIAIDRVCLFPR